MTKINLFNYDKAQLESYFASIGEKPFRAQQLLKWVYQQGITDFSLMSNFSLNLRQKLITECEFVTPKITADNTSPDGTRKWLFNVGGVNNIETVFIPETNRGTLCISSQVGCALNCSFCATGHQGFNRDLTTAEIISQLWLASQILTTTPGYGPGAITNVVMMGMGEPLMNYKNLLPALRLMLDDNAFGLSKRRVTVSTSGVVPLMDKLFADCDCALAVSLHAPNDELRNVLVPINKKYPLQQLLAACKRYVGQDDRKRHVTIEYVMLDGVNDTVKHAKQLITILQGISAKVNLIPFNTFSGTQYRQSSSDAIAKFQQALIKAGIFTTIRTTRGEKIAAACGQLAGDFHDRTSRSRLLQQKITISN